MTSSALAAVRPSLPDIGTATLPVSYERAKTALAMCNEIDECKDWADKSAALASYAKQADDQTLHNFATRISARAIRRCGELLKTFQSNGGRPTKTSAVTDTGFSQREAAERAGLSKRQEVTAVRVANVPADDFEAAVESDDPPTVTRLAELGTASKSVSPFIQATHAIAELREFAAWCQTHPADVVADGIYGHEVSKVRAHTATIEAWLVVFVAHLTQEAGR
jgi:hypothetical protein